MDRIGFTVFTVSFFAAAYGFGYIVATFMLEIVI